MTEAPCHIVFDCEKMKNPNTGIFYYCLHLGSALQKAIDMRQETVSYYKPKNVPALFGANASYRRQEFWHKFYNAASRKADVWHCNYQLSNYLPGRGTKMVLTIHDLNFLIDTQKEDPAKVKKYVRKLQSVVDHADHVVCISEYTKHCLMENIQLGDKKSDVIYNGCEVREFPAFDEPAYKPSRPFIFSIGIFFPKKNFHVLPALLQRNDFELVIAGTRIPGYEKVIREEAAKEGVLDRVKLVGEISEQEKYWYYKNCQAFVFPSLAEGFGLPAVEAMYFGKPVFLSRSTSLPEIGGDLAYYFDSFEPEQMRSVFHKGMNNFDEMRSDELRKRARQFSWEQAAREYVAIYRKLCPNNV